VQSWAPRSYRHRQRLTFIVHASARHGESEGLVSSIYVLMQTSCSSAFSHIQDDREAFLVLGHAFHTSFYRHRTNFRGKIFFNNLDRSTTSKPDNVGSGFFGAAHMLHFPAS